MVGSLGTRATAAATLAGNAFGAGDGKKLKELGKTMVPLEITLMVISGGLLFLFAEPLVCLFSRDPEVIRLGTGVRYSREEAEDVSFDHYR